MALGSGRRRLDIPLRKGSAMNDRKLNDNQQRQAIIEHALRLHLLQCRYLCCSSG
jgi:hypothetical protein